MLIALPRIPHRKTLTEQFWPAVLAMVVVLIGATLIPIHYPVHVSQGQITPDIVHPGEKVQVRWRQDWHDLCPITVQREFVGADSFKKTSATLLYEPPAEKGWFPYTGEIVVPELPAGEAYYHSVITPHCWVDRLIWQRSYRTPDIAVTIVKPVPPGPR